MLKGKSFCFVRTFLSIILCMFTCLHVSLSWVLNFDTFYPSCCPEGGNFDTCFQKMSKSQPLYISPLGLNTDKCIIDLHLIKLNWPWK